MAKLAFDHAVINTRYQMDEAQSRFESLGFDLTERGFHSLGSINHLMMFGTDYLELIGLPVRASGEPASRPGISDAPLGLNGLVFKTDDAQAVFARLQQLGFAGDPPKSFSRPVQTPSGTEQARFTTVHVRPDVFPAGRVYFCEHATPELVWPQPSTVHPNHAASIAQMVVVASDANDQVDKFAALLQVQAREAGAGVATLDCDRGTIAVMTPDAYAHRYGEFAVGGDRNTFFGALVLLCDDMSALRALAANWPVPVNDDGQALALRQPEFDCVLQFVPIAPEA